MGAIVVSLSLDEELAARLSSISKDSGLNLSETYRLILGAGLRLRALKDSSAEFLGRYRGDHAAVGLKSLSKFVDEVIKLLEG